MVPLDIYLGKLEDYIELDIKGIEIEWRIVKASRLSISIEFSFKVKEALEKGDKLVIKLLDMNKFDRGFNVYIYKEIDISFLVVKKEV